VQVINVLHEDICHLYEDMEKVKVSIGSNFKLAPGPSPTAQQMPHRAASSTDDDASSGAQCSIDSAASSSGAAPPVQQMPQPQQQPEDAPPGPAFKLSGAQRSLAIGAASSKTSLTVTMTLPAAAPELAPAPARPELPPGLIVVPWMLQPSLEKPPTERPCQHEMPEWFSQRFYPDSEDSRYDFRSARDVDSDWTNPLMNMCQGAQDCFDLPRDGLYNLLRQKPSVFFCHRNPKQSGAFCVMFGCANCGCMTQRYCPQYAHSHSHVQPKAMKAADEIRTAYREFIGVVLGWDGLIGVPNERSWPQMPLAMPALLNQDQPSDSAGWPPLPAGFWSIRPVQ
jgi:hypothetical protein